MELGRYAAAFLNTKDWAQAVDWDAAARDFGGAGKPASFRTFVQRARGKYAVAEDGAVGDANAAVAAPVKVKAKRVGGKRKTAEAGMAEDENEDEEGVKASRGREAKKNRNVEVKEEENDVETEDADVEVKQETVDDQGAESHVRAELADVQEEAADELQETEANEMRDPVQDEVHDAEPEEQLSVADNEHDVSRKDSLADADVADKDDGIDGHVVEGGVAARGAEEFEEENVEAEGNSDFYRIQRAFADNLQERSSQRWKLMLMLKRSMSFCSEMGQSLSHGGRAGTCESSREGLEWIW
ncbi:hypothetical protein LTR95_002983 [Oleoguttula sp. CCFEE 5521]